MELKRIIQYSDLYPEEANNLPEAKSLIKGLTRNDLCTITANMVQRINCKPFFDNNLDPRKGEYDFVRFFLSKMSPEYTRDLIERHAVASKNLPVIFKDGFCATSKAAIMSFQRSFFSIMPENTHNFSVHIEENFSKALLLSNEEVYNIDYDEKKYSDESQDLQLARIYLAFNYANKDVEVSDIHDSFRRQLVKSVTLFSFLFNSKDKRLKVLRGKFLAHFHISHWIEYIIPHITSIHYLKENSGLLILKGAGLHGKKARRVVEKSCIDKDEVISVKDNLDFTKFRSKPFIRMNKHQYAITNPSFVIEHMFNSVYFELKQYRKDAGFLNDDEFRQYYTTEFSQKYMFEGFVNKILPHNMVISLSGSQCDRMIDEASHSGRNTKGIVPPDYYIRVPEGCILFEYKDALTNAKVKESRNAEKLFAEIKKKFFENEKGSHKGVTQLLDCAKAIQDESFFFDSPSSEHIIYPVLVVDNPVYTMDGMHTILESMMRKECMKRGMRPDKIKPLILLDVATLKLYADYMNRNGLVKTFESYYNHVNVNGNIAKHDPFKSLISFSEFMKDKDMGNMGNVYDRLIREAEPILRHCNKGL